MKQHLEARVVAALKGDNLPAARLLGLLDETHSAIGQAELDAKTARRLALDVLASPDPQLARARSEDLAFRCERLRALLPRLEARYQHVLATEERNRWLEKHDTLKSKRDALAAELSTTYPEVTAKLADLFSRITANDVELGQLHAARPSGTPLHLIGAEQKARGVADFSPANPAIAKELRLPDWQDASRMIWPPPEVPFAVIATAAVAGVQRHVGPNWFEGKQERAATRRAESERVAAYYNKQQREREDRENRERVR